MKLVIRYLVMTFMLFYNSLAQNQITFQVDMSITMRDSIFEPINGDTVVVRGNFNNWYGNAEFLIDSNLDSIYMGTYDISGTIGDTIIFKYVINKQNGIDLWEWNPNPPIGSREFILTGNPQTLPIVLFDIDKDSLVNQLFPIWYGPIVNDGGSSHGCSWVDYDNDQDIDLFVVNDGDNFLYNNNGNATFTKITQGNIVNDIEDSQSASWGDYNNDGYLDLFVVNRNNLNNSLYMNNGNSTFSKITQGVIVNDGGNSIGCSWGDYDNDGYIDLYVCNCSNEDNYLYKNNGDSTFTKITQGNIVNDGGSSSGCSWADYDNDGDLDLFIANDGFNFLYSNNGDGSFNKITQGDVVNDIAHSACGSWGDYDNDGDLDLFVANFSFEPMNNFLYSNNGDGTFTKIAQGEIVNDSSSTWGSSWGDYDNDGDLDMFIANYDQSNILYSNNSDGTFSKETLYHFNIYESWGCTFADYDSDGDLDLFSVNGGGDNNFLFSNWGNSNHWIKIKCQGSISNRSAIGTQVKIKANISGLPTWQIREILGQTGFGSQNGLNAEFGLGNATIIDSLVLQWPSGTQQILTNQTVDQYLVIEEPAQNIESKYIFESSGKIESGVTSLDQNTFYVASSGGVVSRIDSSGNLIYSLNVNGDVKSSTTITSDHSIYIASTDNNLYSFNKNGVSNSGWPVALGSEVTASVAIDNNQNIYIGTQNGIYQCISPDGSVLWSYNVNAPVYSSSVISSDNTLYVTNTGGRLYAFDLNTLDPQNVNFKWSLESGSNIVSSPAIDDQGHLYLTTLDGKLLRVSDHSTYGSIDWEFVTGHPIESSPVLDQAANIYFGCDNGFLYAVDSTAGEMLWSTETNLGIKSTAAIAECKSFSDRLYIGSNDRTLCAISLSDGSVLWKYYSKAAIRCPVLYQEGKVYFGDLLGNVICLIEPEYIEGEIYLAKNTFQKSSWSTFQGNNQRTGNQSDHQATNPSEISTFQLKQNYPNPFNGVTKIEFNSVLERKTTLIIFNITGEKITTLFNGNPPTTTTTVTWDGTNEKQKKVASGIYLVQLNSEGRSMAKKIIYIR